jgi:MFS family permease
MRWPNQSPHAERVAQPRDDIVRETLDPSSPDDGGEQAEKALLTSRTDLRFVQGHGPFANYERTVRVDEDRIVEHTRYRLRVPWFGWMFQQPVRGVLARRLKPDGWWTPPDRLDATQILVLGLLAAASMSAAFVNTLFTQTVNFAADEFGVSDTAIGVAGAVVRAGIVIALPAAVVADRIGRRRVIVVVAWLGPLLSLSGALAPSFPVLVATQTLARPMGIALAFLIGVVAAEEMPRNSRAYAVSLMAMASGFGAGIAVLSLRLADMGDSGWRLVYLVAAVWCVVALDLGRRLPETRRFEAAHITVSERPPRLDRHRLGLLAAVAFLSNILVAAASFFQNNYLTDIRGFSGGMIGIFSIGVGTPAAVGLIIGGRLADTSGRRRLIAVALPLSTMFVVAAFAVGGPLLWLFALLGGLFGSAAWPALAVYRAELFPTSNRSRAAGLITGAALIGGIIGLVATGWLLDAGWSYASVMTTLAVGPAMVTLLVIVAFPETAHLELEELNPEDRPIDLSGT